MTGNPETPNLKPYPLIPDPQHRNSKFEIIHPIPYTLHPTTYTLHPTPYTLHPTPYTLHPTSYILHPTLYTLNLKL